jgi:hypothetical protein
MAQPISVQYLEPLEKETEDFFNLIDIMFSCRRVRQILDEYFGFPLACPQKRSLYLTFKICYQSFSRNHKQRYWIKCSLSRWCKYVAPNTFASLYTDELVKYEIMATEKILYTSLTCLYLTSRLNKRVSVNAQTLDGDGVVVCILLKVQCSRFGLTTNQISIICWWR